jgi:hypothetical protein
LPELAEGISMVTRALAMGLVAALLSACVGQLRRDRLTALSIYPLDDERADA